MATTTKTFAANGSWICPPGVSSIQVEAWGGGGAGGAATGNPAGGGGGAGGAYAKKATFAVVAGTTYTVTVGGTVTGNTTNTQAQNKGNASWFSSNDTNGVVAEGGLGGNPATANSSNGATAAGSSAASFGDGGAVFKGGDGAAGVFGTKGGGGGEGAGTTAAGHSAVGGTGGTGGDGGDGGAGGAPGVAGSTGTATGGGGGGGDANAVTDRAGGNGAAGQVKLTYTTPKLESLTDNFDDNSQNVALWTFGTVGAGSTTAESGQKVIETPASNVVSAESYVVYLNFDPAFDLTGSYALINVKQILNLVANTTTQLALIVDGSNYCQMVVDGSGTLFAQYQSTAAGFNTVSTIAYNSSTMAWFRIRESGGTIFWDYTDNPINGWTNFTSIANPFTVTALYPKFNAVANNVASPGAAWFDNFNVIPSAVTTKTLAALGVG